jgi:hypothetical protein
VKLCELGGFGLYVRGLVDCFFLIEEKEDGNDGAFVRVDEILGGRGGCRDVC